MSYANPGGDTPVTGYRTGTQLDLGPPKDPIDSYLGRALTGETGMQNTTQTYGPDSIRNAYTFVPTKDQRIEQLQRERDYLHERLDKAEEDVKVYYWTAMALGAAAVALTLALLAAGIGGAK